MENREIEIKGKGIKVSILSSIFIALAVIIMIISFGVISKIYAKFDDMAETHRNKTNVTDTYSAEAGNEEFFYGSSNNYRDTDKNKKIKE